MSGLRQGLTVSLLTLCSRLLGFARETVAAQLFGAGAATDAFFAVFRLPNLLRQVFAEGAFTLALVPLLHAAGQRGGGAAVNMLASRTLGALLLVLGPLLMGTMLLAPHLVRWLLPGLSDIGTLALATRMAWWTLPYVLMAVLVGWSAALLHARDRFATASFTPLLLSISMIGVPLLCAAHLQPPVMALAIAVFIGGVLQMAWQGAALLRLGVPLRPRWDWRHPELRAVLRVLLPSLLAASTLQVILVVDSAFATRLAPGSVTWLYLADRVVQFPQGIIGTALSVVLVQRLSARHISAQDAAQTLGLALRLVLVLATLSAICGWYCAEAISWTLYGYGAFKATDVQMTADAIRVMAAGLPAVLLVRALSAACLARSDLRLLLLASLLALLADVIGNLLLMQGGWTTGLSHVRIAAVSALAVWIYAGGLLLGLRRRQGWRLQPGAAVFALRVLLAAVVCSLLLHGLQHRGVLQLGSEEAWVRLWRLAAVLTVAVLSYFGVAAVAGLRLRHLRQAD